MLSNTFGSLIASEASDDMEGVLGYSAWRWYATLARTQEHAADLDRIFYIEGALAISTAPSLCSFSRLPIHFPPLAVPDRGQIG